MPRITGGGIPEIEDVSEDYFAPLVVHAGCGEPEVRVMSASVAARSERLQDLPCQDGTQGARRRRRVLRRRSQGECLAIVGESGSGKSTIANMILGIYPQTSGEIAFRGSALPARRDLAHRRAIQLVQQNPLSSLNPKRSIGASLRLALDVHGIGEQAGRGERTGQLLEEVGLPADFRTRSPAALSGGQRQRVAIARALACQSELVVLDEPTSALDVLVQARVLKLLNELRAQAAA